MFEDALNYPRQGDDWLTTVLVGGGLRWVAVIIALVSIPLMLVFVGFLTTWLALIPGVFLAGYSVAVAGSVLDSDPVPPAFEDWQRLFVDGLKLILVGIVYAIPYALLTVLFVVFVVVGGRTGAAFGVLLVGLGFLYGIVVLYLFPISLVNMAREDEVAGAFSLDVLRDVALDGDYAVSWLLGVAVYVLAAVAISVLAIVVVGILLAPFVQFYAQVSATYLVTRGFMDATDRPFAPSTSSGDDGGSDRQATLGEPAGDDSTTTAVSGAPSEEDAPEHGPAEDEREEADNGESEETDGDEAEETDGDEAEESDDGEGSDDRAR